jgi:hypothetical protein
MKRACGVAVGVGDGVAVGVGVSVGVAVGVEVVVGVGVSVAVGVSVGSGVGVDCRAAALRVHEHAVLTASVYVPTFDRCTLVVPSLDRDTFEIEKTVWPWVPAPKG